MTTETDTEQTPKRNPTSSWFVVSLIIAVVIVIAVYILSGDQEQPLPPSAGEQVAQQQGAQQTQPQTQASDLAPDEPMPAPKIAQEPAELNFDDIQGEASASQIQPSYTKQAEANEESKQSLLPALNHSDAWFNDQLIKRIPTQVLHSLVVKSDIIRKFVVFTDNFSQGIVAYKHSPLVKLAKPFRVQALATANQASKEELYQGVATNLDRFIPYLDLVLALDNDTLVAWYHELAPLFNEAYAELGYEEQSFLSVVQLAIGRITTFEMPTEALTLTQPHVMYQYQNQELESLADADKLLIRLGQANLTKLQQKLTQVNQLLNQP